MAEVQENYVHELSTKPGSSGSVFKSIVILLIVVLLGVGAGYFLSNSTDLISTVQKKTAGTLGSSKKTEGVKDDKRFPDSAEGILKEGGVEGEGNFHLERPGGESQNVYLTSSIVDLSGYIDKKIKVMGQTFEGQTAGWLMDVGYVEVK
ncbi:MAG: hypothetical protein AAB966_02215 [Patescibacteria group bacterium]